VPTNRWVTLAFEHDGFAKMQLLVDRQLVGEAIVDNNVPGVAGSGVSVGNRLSGSRPLLGDIEELRIWRFDPRQMQRDFLCRPYTAKTAKCWEDIFRRIGQWLRDHPAEAQSLADAIAALQRKMLHGLYLLPQAERTQLSRVAGHYQQLWCDGNIEGPEMSAIFIEFIRILRRHGLDPASEPVWNELKSQLQQMSTELHGFDLNCDPAVLALSGLIRDADKEAK
jgi:hypothetical protein